MSEDREEEFKKLVNLVTEEAAKDILPRLKIVNGQLRGVIDTKTRLLNYNMLSNFITEVYQRALEDGYKLGISDKV